MAKRKTGFVMVWLDDTQYWERTATQLRLSLVREDTNTFFARRTAPLDMDIFCEHCFGFELAARQGLGRSRACRAEDSAIPSLQLIAKSLCFTQTHRIQHA